MLKLLQGCLLFEKEGVLPPKIRICVGCRSWHITGGFNWGGIWSGGICGHVMVECATDLQIEMFQQPWNTLLCRSGLSAPQ